jgi:hypothetical protein
MNLFFSVFLCIFAQIRIFIVEFKKYIIMKRKNINTIIKEDIEYKLQDVDELYNYMWLKPDVTNIDADIFVDDGEAYIRDRHVPLLFVRNGKGREIIEFIPISISQTPKILDNNLAVAIGENTINQVFDFIKANTMVLMDMANGKLNAEEFISVIKIPTYVTEEKHLINEGNYILVDSK